MLLLIIKPSINNIVTYVKMESHNCSYLKSKEMNNFIAHKEKKCGLISFKILYSNMIDKLLRYNYEIEFSTVYEKSHRNTIQLINYNNNINRIKNKVIPINKQKYKHDTTLLIPRTLTIITTQVTTHRIKRYYFTENVIKPQLLKKVINTYFNGIQKEQYFVKMPKKTEVLNSDLRNMIKHDFSVYNPATKTINGLIFQHSKITHNILDSSTRSMTKLCSNIAITFNKCYYPGPEKLKAIVSSGLKSNSPLMVTPFKPGIYNSLLLPPTRTLMPLINCPLKYPGYSSKQWFGVTQANPRVPGMLSTTIVNSNSFDEQVNRVLKQKSEVTYTNHLGKEYVTTVNEKSSATDFEEQDLVNELKKRGLVKDLESSKVQVNIKTKDDLTVSFGGSRLNVKLTVLGQAYVEQIQQGEDKFQITAIPPIISKEINFIIGVPQKATNDIFIETGLQKHLLIIVDAENNNYFGVGYLTSKKNEHYLCDIKVKKFQDNMENLDKKDNQADTESSVKSAQFFHRFSNLIPMSTDEFIEIKWDQEYFAQVPTKVLENLEDYVKFLTEKPLEKLTAQFFTKDKALKMCKEYDKIVKAKETNNNVKQPLSLHQKEQQESNKQKIKEMNATKVTNKETYENN